MLKNKLNSKTFDRMNNEPILLMVNAINVCIIIYEHK